MEIRLTADEAPRIAASVLAIEAAKLRAQTFVQAQNTIIGGHRARLEALAVEVRSRLPELPAVPVEQWDLSRLDPITFEGSITIPELPKKE